MRIIRRISYFVIAACIVFKYLASVRREYVFLSDLKSKYIPRNIDHSQETYIFVHVTDTHINTVYNKKSLSRFHLFIDEMNHLKPKFIVHTGDIVDSYSPTSKGSICEEDFIKYEEEINRLEGIPVYDIRGNHDVFGKINNGMMKYLHSKDRFYYKIVGRDLYLFLDATPNFATKRFLNFFGQLKCHNSSFNLKRSDLLKIRKAFNNIIFASHYPSNTLNVSSNIFPIFELCDVYLCGHYHDLKMFRNIYKQHTTFFEAELLDFKDNQMYRVCTSDMGQINFSDFHLYDRVKFIVYNPPDVRYLRNKEKYVKFSVLSHGIITDVRILCDDAEIPCEMVGKIYYGNFEGLDPFRIVISANMDGQVYIREIKLRTDESYTAFILKLNFRLITNILLLIHLILFAILRDVKLIDILRFLSFFVCPLVIADFRGKGYELLMCMSFSSCSDYGVVEYHVFDTVIFFSYVVGITESLQLLFRISKNSVFLYLYVLSSLCLVPLLYSHFGSYLSLFDLWLLYTVMMFVRG